VICRPYWRKEIQRVMNRQQSTSILGKRHPENHKGEGSAPSVRHYSALTPAARMIFAHFSV
jgi:hypothetical protein